MSQAHAETQAGAMTLTSAGTAANPIRILCVNDAAEPPIALATTATVSVSGNVAMGFVGYAISYGITYRNTGAVNNAGAIFNWTTLSTIWIYIDCGISNASISSTPRMNIGSSPNAEIKVIFKNVVLTFGNASQGILLNGAIFELIFVFLSG